MPITNRRIVDKESEEFYPTPEWCTRALLAHEPIEGEVWEPACGDGAISKVLEANGLKVISTDLYGRGYGESGVDFLRSDLSTDVIVTNPPYNLAERFVAHGIHRATKKVILLLRLSFLESASRWITLFNPMPPTTVWVFSERITFYPNGNRTAGTGTTAYAWFVWDHDKMVWDKALPARWTMLNWIRPGFKD